MSYYLTSKLNSPIMWGMLLLSNKILEAYINIYAYYLNDGLKILKFDEMTNEWLDFVAVCRAGNIHDYDIVEGPMANDTVWNYVNDYLAGDISKAAFWELAKFKHPTHQISFHTLKALDCLS